LAYVNAFPTNHDDAALG